jgi:hypothetical protein
MLMGIKLKQLGHSKMISFYTLLIKFYFREINDDFLIKLAMALL